MARWKLQSPHYLRVPGTEWEYRETDQATGKQARKVYEVPLYLNPGDKADHNYPGEIVVTDGNGADPRDIHFLGEPTPDMDPLDDDARRVSDKFRHKWKNPIESLPTDFGQSMIAAPPAAQPGTVSKEISTGWRQLLSCCQRKRSGGPDAEQERKASPHNGGSRPQSEVREEDGHPAWRS
jgi:hypothetical protein